MSNNFFDSALGQNLHDIFTSQINQHLHNIKRKCSSLSDEGFIKAGIEGHANNMMLLMLQYRIDQFFPKTVLSDFLSYELHAML